MVYSGYTFEQLNERQDDETNRLLNNIDVLVDGRFVESEKKPNLKFRGSANQRIIDVPESLKVHKVISLDL